MDGMYTWWFPSISHGKDLLHHPLETSIYLYKRIFQVPGLTQVTQILEEIIQPENRSSTPPKRCHLASIYIIDLNFLGFSLHPKNFQEFHTGTKPSIWRQKLLGWNKCSASTSLSLRCQGQVELPLTAYSVEAGRQKRNDRGCFACCFCSPLYRCITHPRKLMAGHHKILGGWKESPFSKPWVLGSI